MTIANNFFEYQDEIELIEAQNRVESDLYSIIAQIIRENTTKVKISLRDVTTRRNTDFSIPFRGNSGFPDFVIRTRDKHSDAKILGAIEAKYVTEDLNLEKYLEQLDGHIDFYKRVIYTNGIVWRYYNGYKPEENWEIVLGQIIDKKIEWEKDEKWQNLLTKLIDINWL